MSDASNPFQQSAQQQPQQQSSLNSLSQEVGYEIPVESVGLPSKGLIYSVDHPLCNADLAEIRCMTAREEDLLTSHSLIKNGTVISKLIQACLLNKSVDPETLLTGDRNALLIAIRVTGYGANYTVKIECPDCEEQYENEFSLSGLEMKGLGAEPLAPNLNLFSYTLPMTKQEVQFKLLTGKDEAEMMDEEKRRKKLHLSQVNNSVTSRLKKSIVSINGVTDGSKLVRQINNMPAGDSRSLRNYIDKIEPSVEMKQFAKCSNCGEQSEVNIPLGITFFWPDASK